MRSLADRAPTPAPAICTRSRRSWLVLPRRDPSGNYATDRHGHPIYPALSCPVGHAIPWEWNVIGDAFPRCTHDWERDPGKRGCGLRVWVCRMEQRAAPGFPWYLVAEVDGREIAYMSQLYMAPDQIVDWLGLSGAIARGA